MEVKKWDKPKYITHHLMNIYKDEACKEHLVTFFFGDDVLGVTEDENGKTKVLLTGNRVGWVKSKINFTDNPPLTLSFIDVGQGDACLITTPNNENILIDGGENQLAARYLAKRFSHETSEGKTILFDAIVITHGDADHFAGLTKLVIDSANEERDYKRIRVATKRIYHNGLVKRSPKIIQDGTKIDRKEKESLGKTEIHGDKLFVTELIEDPRTLDDSELNQHFRRWKTALETLAGRNDFIIKRIDASTTEPFDFLKSIDIQVLGPKVESLNATKVGLQFLNNGASSTINGHSIILKIKYKNVRALLTGDLNRDIAEELVSSHSKGEIDLESEILKVPHHGSDDYSIDFLKAIKPVVSIISSGDENAAKDYLHPRANVVGALGNSGRGDEPLIFVTNLSAFDSYVGPSIKAIKDDSGDWVPDPKSQVFYARERKVYGIVHVRTDGEQIFIARHGAKPNQKEVYTFIADGEGNIKKIPTRKI